MVIMNSRKSQKVEALVVKAIRQLQDIQGSTPREISNYIAQEYDVPGPEVRRQVQLALKRGVTYGILERIKGGLYTYNRDVVGEHVLNAGDATIPALCDGRRMRRGRKRSRRRGRKSRRRSGKKRRGRSKRKSRGRSGRRSRRSHRGRKGRRRESRKREFENMETEAIAKQPKRNESMSRKQSPSGGSLASGDSNETPECHSEEIGNRG